jgi:hypothetical protein
MRIYVLPVSFRGVRGERRESDAERWILPLTLVSLAGSVEATIGPAEVVVACDKKTPRRRVPPRLRDLTLWEPNLPWAHYRIEGNREDFKSQEALGVAIDASGGFAS